MNRKLIFGVVLLSCIMMLGCGKKQTSPKVDTNAHKQSVADVYPDLKSDDTEKEVATSSDPDTVVHITRTGAKYHAEGCRFLSRSDIPVPLSKAIEDGYEPCSKCSPPE